MDTTFAGRLTASLLVVAVMLGCAAGARATEPAGETEAEAAGRTPLRLGFTSGEVRFWRPGTESWVPAQVNIPLVPGDQLATDHLGNIEVQTGPDSFLRVWGDSRLALVSHEENALRLGMTSGYLGLDLRTVPPGMRVYVDTPHAAVAIGQAGYYRIDVSADRTAVIARRGGRATVTAHGHTASVASDHQLLAGARAASHLEPTAAPETDTWDRWSLGRTDTLLAAESTRYVAPQVYGVADLDRHGTWREEPTYGPLWEPSSVPAGWVPYSTGTWISDPIYGWTWVDSAPWGWAPYHYGRWVFVNGGWAWAPGPRVVRPVYAPALVAFFGPPQPVSRPFVSWVALGWGEPLVPWWGRPGFVGRPWYAGWAGPRHWHRDGFHGRPFDYRNVGVRNAVIGMHRDRFGRERVERARLASVDVSRLQPVRDPRPERDGGARDRTRGRAEREPSPVPSPSPERRDEPRARVIPSQDGDEARSEPEPPRERRPERQGPGVRPDVPRERQTPPPRAPRADSPPPRRTPSPQQHWRRTGDHPMGGMHRDRRAPANVQREPQSRGRR